jgi:hypothetical protein
MANSVTLRCPNLEIQPKAISPKRHAYITVTKRLQKGKRRAKDAKYTTSASPSHPGKTSNEMVPTVRIAADSAMVDCREPKKYHDT